MFEISDEEKDNYLHEYSELKYLIENQKDEIKYQEDLIIELKEKLSRSENKRNKQKKFIKECKSVINDQNR